MGKWIDLTMLLDDLYKPYPGDETFKIASEKAYDLDGYSLKRIDSNMHVGTHIDAPMHMLDSDLGIETIDINQVIGKAIVIKPTIDFAIIDTKSIAKLYEPGYKILVLNLDHAKHQNTDKYYDLPMFDPKFFDFLKDNKIEVVALDLPTVQYYFGETLQMHKDLLGENILIIENLTNLDKLSKHIDFIGLPLKIKGLDGSMIRCVAKNK